MTLNGAASDLAEPPAACWRFPARDPDDAPDDFPAIDDYAIIGDCRTAALVAASGAIEWLCLPDMASASVFAAILDRAGGGSFVLRPAAACRVTRRYLAETAVLETTFETAGGRARMLDFVCIGAGESRWQARIQPQREIVRLLEGLEGSVEFLAIVDARPDYGRRRGTFARRPGFGWVLPGPGSLLAIDADFPLAADRDGARLVGRTALPAGESRSIALSYAANEIAVRPSRGAAAREGLGAAVAWWTAWSARCVFTGPRRDLVVRSAITLKLLTYSLSGAVMAAATTSLPESIGAGRNWDYRFCWLRDASVTMHAFLGLGLREEADAFIGWMLHATRLTRPELRILYDVHGRNDASEATLDHLEGYRRSKPVRIGNAAGDQLQLDTYGSVIAAAYEYIAKMGTLHGGEMRLLRDFGEVVCRRWQEPDQSLWEVRGKPRHFTATKVMCWVALDRLIKLAEEGKVEIPLARFRANRAALAALVEERGYSEALGSYVAEIDGGAPAADAAVLLMGVVGFGDLRSERLRGTLRWVEQQLGRDGLYARYAEGFDGDPSREGAFGICMSWAIESIAGQGDVADAVRALDRFAATANDLGLFAEEYDAEKRSSLGNFPQAFTHAGFISAALAVQRAEADAGGAATLEGSR